MPLGLLLLLLLLLLLMLPIGCKADIIPLVLGSANELHRNECELGDF